LTVDWRGRRVEGRGQEKRYWKYTDTRVLEQINLFILKSKNIYFERKAPQEIIRPCLKPLNLIYGFLPLFPTLCPLSSF
jgi:hypothetical protein